MSLALPLLGIASPASAAVPLTRPGIEIDFADYLGLGLAPMPAVGQLDSDDWSIEGLSSGDVPFGATAELGDVARGLSNGGVIQGGLYAFDVTGEAMGTHRTLGWQATGGDLTPGAFVLAVHNDTALPITVLQVGFSVWALNDADRSTRVTPRLSTDGLSFTEIDGAVVRSPTTADMLVQWELETVDATVTGVSLPVGEDFYLRWETADEDGLGIERDELALDAISITVMGQCGDGSVDSGEACDESIVDPGDPDFVPGCGGGCTFFCGDGQLDPPEQCDDGPVHDGHECQPDCTLVPGPGSSGSSSGDTGTQSTTQGFDPTTSSSPDSGGLDTSTSTTGGIPPASSGDGPAGSTSSPTTATTATSGQGLPDSFGGLEPLDDDGCFCRPGRGSSGGTASLLLVLLLGRRRRQAPVVSKAE